MKTGKREKREGGSRKPGRRQCGSPSLLCCFLSLSAALLPAFAGLSAAHSAPLHRYQVEVGESLERIGVRACFDGAAPEALVPGTDGARAFLEKIRLPGVASTRLPVADRIPLQGLPDNACVEYRVQLQAAREGVQTGGPESRWVGRDLLTAVGDWLWRPPGAADVEVEFRMPAGVNVSAPWTRTGPATFRSGSTPQDWPGVVAFGRFGEKRIEAPGAVLRLAMLDSPPPAQQAWIEQWIADAARNVATLTGRFPVDALQVVVVPIARGGGPVPWAYVARGGGPAVHLFINPGHSPQAFARDWSATHEMAHLFLPYVASRDAWFSEGVPTYLQNLLMARGGAIDEREAWKRMIVGFQRAEKVGVGLGLARASERAGIGGLYQRVYWAGAALMLEADLGLRGESGGAGSLAAALQALAQCCFDPPRRWSAAELAEQMDRATGSNAFGDIVRTRLDDPAFPDFKAALVRAGVTVSGGEVQLDASAPWAGPREALTRRP